MYCLFNGIAADKEEVQNAQNCYDYILVIPKVNTIVNGKSAGQSFGVTIAIGEFEIWMYFVGQGQTYPYIV